MQCSAKMPHSAFSKIHQSIQITPVFGVIVVFVVIVVIGVVIFIVVIVIVNVVIIAVIVVVFVVVFEDPLVHRTLTFG